MLIDTHAHLYYDQFAPDFDQVIERVKAANLKAIINIGADLESSRKSLRQAQGKLAGIECYTSIGLHPHESSRITTLESIHENVEKLEQIYHNNTGKIVAIGECGLDFHFEGTDYAPSSLPQNKQVTLQKQLFKDQINMAKKLGLPLVIHCRDAWENIFLLELQDTTGVFHSFTATENEAKKALDLGYYLGFSCIVTYPKNDHLRAILKWAPLDRIMTETDCPFLPPQSQRGQRNEPANITEVINVIAEAKNLTQEEVSWIVWQNATKLFKFTI